MDLKPIVLESKAQSEVKIGLENKLQKINISFKADLQLAQS